MKRFLSLIILICFVLNPLSSFAATSEPKPEAEAYLLMDMSTGKVLLEKNSGVRNYPASTTKIMTCILAIENLDLSGHIVGDDETAAIKGSIYGLAPGEQMSVDTALYAMMVPSANDLAVAFAKKVAGSVNLFSKMMNAKAEELGAVNTHFVNPHGLHDEEHYTTAYDLALIARYAMQNAKFRDVVSTAHYTIPATGLSDAKTVDNTNLLLYDESEKSLIYVDGIRRYSKYEGTIGIKTGSTPQAGGCLVAACEKNGTTLLSVVLKSSAMGRFADTISLFNWGFANYSTHKIMSIGTDLGTIRVKRGSDNSVGVVMSSDALATLPSGASSEIFTTEVLLSEDIRAPFTAGTVVGEVDVYEGGNLIASYPAITADGMEKGGILSIFGITDATAKKIFTGIILFFVLVLAVFIAWIFYKRAETKRKKQRLAQRKAELAAKREAARKEWEKNYRNRYR